MVKPIAWLFLLPFCLFATDYTYTWNVDGNGNWSVNSNWTSSPPGGTFPSSTSDTANFGTISGAAKIVTIDTSSASAGTVTFSGTGSYTIAGLNSLTVGGTVTVSTNNVDHTISAPMILAADTTFTIATGTLSLSGTISGPFGITTTGTLSGSIVLTGSNSYSGITNIQKGRVYINQSSSLGTGGTVSSVVNAFGDSRLVFTSSFTLDKAINAVPNSILDISGTSVNPTIRSFTGDAANYSVFRVAGNNTNFTISHPSTLTGDGNTINLIGGGELIAGTNNAIPNVAFNFANGSKMNLNGFSNQIPLITNISDTGAEAILLNGGTLNLGPPPSGASYPTSVAVTIVGPGTFNIINTGSTVFLSGGNSSSQTTTILNGGSALLQNSGNTIGGADTTILLNANNNLGFSAATSPVTVQPFISLGVYTLTINTADTFGATPKTMVTTGGSSGSGGITKINGGTLTFSGTNGYTGTTSITGGAITAGMANAFPPQSPFVLDNTAGVVLSLSGFDNSIGSLAGGGSTGGSVDLGNGGNLTVGANNISATFSGTITGMGNLIKTGTGTLALGGTSSRVGATTLNQGILNISNLTALGTSGATITVTGSGALQAAAAFTGGNSITNPISVSAGQTFSFDTNGFNVDSTGSFAFDGAYLQKLGTGILSIQSSLSSTGSVTVSAGTLDLSAVTGLGSIVGDLSSASAGALVLGDKTLQFGASGATTFAGDLTGVSSSALTKQGTGSINVTGTMSVPTITVTSGAFSANGTVSASTSFTLDSGATLNGIGMVSSPLASIRGNLTPGNSIGTIHFTGFLDIDNTSVTTIELNPTTSSLIAVAGSASMDPGANLQLIVTGGVPKSEPYTILTATEGVVGCFTLTQPAGYTFNLLCSANSVQISLGSFASAFTTNGLTGNELAVGNYLNTLTALSSMTDVLRSLSFLTFSQLEEALNAISPARNSFTTYATENTAFTVIRTANQRVANQRMRSLFDRAVAQLACIPSEENLWAANTSLPLGKTETAARKENTVALYWNNIGEFLHQGSESQNPPFSTASAGWMLGGDYYGINNALVGGSGTYVHNWLYNQDGLGNANVDSIFLTGYATGYIRDFYIEGELLLGYNMFSNKRIVSFPGFSGTAKSNHNGWQLTESIGAGYDWAYKSTVLEPFINFGVATNFESGFSEQGASPLDMEQPSHNSTLLQLEFGGNAYQIWNETWGFLTLKGSLSYVYQQPISTGYVSANIVDAPGSFVVHAFQHGIHLVSPGLEVFYRIQNSFMALTYQGRFGSSYQSNDAIVKLGMFF